MVIIVRDYGDTKSFFVSSNDYRFVNKWGKELVIQYNRLYMDLKMFSDWCNRSYHEECVFKLK